MLLGVVVFDLDNEYFSRLVMELEALCRGEGYSSVVMFSHKSAQQEIDCLNQLVHMGVDGIVLCPVGWGIPFARYLQGLRTPVVTVDNRLEVLPFCLLYTSVKPQGTAAAGIGKLPLQAAVCCAAASIL